MAERKYAIQRPKGSTWETLSLVDDLGHGKSEFRNAVNLHGAGPVRLIQVDFVSDEALADFDWRLIELHDPRKGGRPKPTLVAGSERSKPSRSASKSKATSGRAKSEKADTPVPVKTYLLLFLFGFASLAIWELFYRH